jgi:hypothetical protein
MEQLERTRRYLQRIRNIYAGVPYISETREYHTDDVFSFFVHCHHIKDWVVSIRRFRATSKEVDKFINSHQELRICADLCNGTKHCRLTRNMRTKRQPHMARKTFESDGNQGVFHTTKGQLSILSDGKFYDALVLAESCMRLWDDFIARKSATAGMES